LNSQTLAHKINSLNDLQPEQREMMTRAIKDKIIPLELSEHLSKLKNIYQQLG